MIYDSNDSIVRKTKYSISKEAILMKSGAMITSGTESSKYLTMFQTEARESEVQCLKDRLSFYMTGVSDYSLFSRPEYLKRFGDALLSSHILEELSAVNGNKLPIFAYAGQFEPEGEKIAVNRRIEKYFDKMSELVVPTRRQEDNEQR